MTLQIRMLGTGSAFAKKYSNNNALVKSGGFTLLVDAGITAPQALHDMGVDLEEIDGILITHLHADHVGGLEEITFRMKFTHGRKPVLYLPDKLVNPIWEHTLRGGLENVEEGMTGLADYYEVVRLHEGRPAELAPGFRVEILPTRHIPGKPSFCLIFNGQLFYSADTRFDRPLLDRIHYEWKCRHILHDCQLFDPGAVHATLNELLTLPEEIQKKVLLMHYGDDMEEFIGRTGAMTFMRQRETYSFDV